MLRCNTDGVGSGQVHPRPQQPNHLHPITYHRQKIHFCLAVLCADCTSDDPMDILNLFFFLGHLWLKCWQSFIFLSLFYSTSQSFMHRVSHPLNHVFPLPFCLPALSPAPEPLPLPRM